MAISHADAIGESTLTAGTGTLTLTGTALTAHRTFATSAAIGGVGNLSDGATTTIRIDEVDANGNPTGVFEITETVYTLGTNSLTRGTLLTSSTGSRISFAAGTKQVRVVATANYLDQLVTGSGVAKITVGTSTPASPAAGDLWVDTN